jgi:hypothetical protein
MPNPSPENSRCYGFMRGVIEGVIVAETAHGTKEPLFEMTDSVSYFSVVRRARQMVNDTPSSIDLPAAVIVVKAMQDATKQSHQ